MKQGKQGVYARYIKRILDILLSGCALIVLSPVLLIVAVLVRTKLGSPVIFCQERPGKDEKIFKMYKFRSMTDARDENGELLPDEVRLTKFGRALRSTSLDELPELWNIFKGDMSIVGPRPLLVRDAGDLKILFATVGKVVRREQVAFETEGYDMDLKDWNEMKAQKQRERETIQC